MDLEEMTIETPKTFLERLRLSNTGFALSHNLLWSAGAGLLAYAYERPPITMMTVAIGVYLIGGVVWPTIIHYRETREQQR